MKIWHDFINRCTCLFFKLVDIHHFFFQVFGDLFEIITDQFVNTSTVIESNKEMHVGIPDSRKLVSKFYPYANKKMISFDRGTNKYNSNYSINEIYYR